MTNHCAEFRENPYNRRHLQAERAGDLPSDVAGAYVKLRLAHDAPDDVETLRRNLEDMGAFQVLIERQARPSERRREVPLTEGQSSEEQLRTYLEHTYPDEDIDALMDEARRVEEKA